MHSPVSERRDKPRYRLQFPLVLLDRNAGETKGITRDVSEFGVYFFTDSPLAVGQMVKFKMLRPVNGTTARALCNGTVVRIESSNQPASETRGVAVHMTSAQLV